MYDGHGGHEVAVYTAQKLPPFIKRNPKYCKGEVKEVSNTKEKPTVFFPKLIYCSHDLCVSFLYITGVG